MMIRGGAGARLSTPAVLPVAETEHKTTDYKTTLKLPKTDFPMKANLPKREPEMLKHWEEVRLYETPARRAQGRDRLGPA